MIFQFQNGLNFDNRTKNELTGAFAPDTLLLNTKKNMFFFILPKTCVSYPNFWNFSKKITEDILGLK